MSMGDKGNFEQYLARYCSNYNLTREEAIKHKLIQLVKKYYEEES
jgi:transcription initiation factor TFIIIB Brf1 subunit/transcription initiation factor TFIIB